MGQMYLNWKIPHGLQLQLSSGITKDLKSIKNKAHIVQGISILSVFSFEYSVISFMLDISILYKMNLKIIDISSHDFFKVMHFIVVDIAASFTLIMFKLFCLIYVSNLSAWVQVDILVKF